MRRQIGDMNWTMKLCAVLVVFSIGISAKARAEEFVSPDILILGDSQISFGSGPSFLKFFSDIKQQCHPTPKQEKYLKTLGDMKVGVIGVRSTSIHSWTARKGRAKGAVCDVDPKWKVNAGSYGYLNQTGNKYVQIGRGTPYQFCEANKSPFETMFRKDYYDPKLLLLSFLGNSSRRWAESKEMAAEDVKMLTEQLPPRLPCIFMTTAPAFSKKIVERRLKAQKNIMAAFAEAGQRCTFVEGATPETVTANQGNKHYFRLNKRGRVKDPYHPNAKAAENFFALEMDQICGAIFEQISMIMDKPET
ncbi:MAG: SGNH/GDSL hydrolase family protein [Pseudomonadota bacterium]